MMVKRVLLAALLLLFNLAAWASFPATPNTGYEFIHAYDTQGTWTTDKDAACNAGAAADNKTRAQNIWETYMPPIYGSLTLTGTVTASNAPSGFLCTMYVQGSFYQRETLYGRSRSGYSCPANATLSGSTCTCNAGTMEVNGTCVANPCQQGQTKDMQVQLGWVRMTTRSDGQAWETVDGRHYYAPTKDTVNNLNYSPPATLCDGQCKWIPNSAPGDVFVMADGASNGMHALVRDWNFVANGEQCSQKDSPLDSTAPPAACDGYMGTVNGTSVCLSKEMPSSATGKSGPTGPKETGSAQGQAPSATGKGYGPNGEYPGTASDTSGMLDVGGTGKGVTATPSTSTSVNSQGVTTTTTLNIQTCGVPGMPACRLDESGTPTGQGFGDSQKTQLGSDWDKVDKMLPDIQSTAGKDTSWAMPSWLVSDACKPWNLGHFPVIEVDITVDVCPVKPYLDGVLNFMWVFGTFLACLSMVQTVTMGPTKVGS